MANAYTEDRLVEQPAIGLCAELGWSAVSEMEENRGETGTLKRGTKGEVVLVPHPRALFFGRWAMHERRAMHFIEKRDFSIC